MEPPLSLTALARKAFRSGREFFSIADADLHRWAEAQGASRRQALAAALQAGIFPECYERNYPSLEAAQQLRLLESGVLVAGLGGLGGFLAELLARVGVGRLLLADGDIFTPANLNRQLLATRATLGQNKAAAAARHLQDVNPGLLTEVLPHFVDRENLGLHLPRVQAAADGLDSLSARRQLAASCYEAGVPMVHGAVTGRFGQVTTLRPGDAAAYAGLARVLAAEPEPTREVLAPTVSLVASLQVQEILRLLLGQPPAYAGVLAHFDGDTGRLEILPLG